MLRLFLDRISQTNGLDAEDWIFHHAMLFLSRASWWESLNPVRPGIRKTPHEGLDIIFYTDSNNKTRKLNTNTLIPSAAKGKIINICNDFISKSIIVLDDRSRTNEFNIFYVYAHVQPYNNIKTGLRVNPDDIIAKIAQPDVKKTTLLPHLHFSVMEIPKDVPFKDLNWNLFCNQEGRINFINPFFI